MALAKKTQNSLEKYKPKTIGPFTAKQLPFLAGAAVLAIIGWNLLKDSTLDNRAIGTLFFASPMIAMMFSPYGMPMFQYLSKWFGDNIRSKKIRVYCTEPEEEAPKQRSKKKPVKDKEYRSFL